MKIFNLTKASDIKLHEIVFLSNITDNNRVFSVPDLTEHALGEVVSRTTLETEYLFEIRDHTGIYTVAALPWNKFAVYTPNQTLARNLVKGDKILLRGRNSLSSEIICDSGPLSCRAEVLETHHRRKTTTVTLKLQKRVRMPLYFGGVLLPLRASNKSILKLNFSHDTKIELLSDEIA